MAAELIYESGDAQWRSELTEAQTVIGRRPRELASRIDFDALSLDGPFQWIEDGVAFICVPSATVSRNHVRITRVSEAGGALRFYAEDEGSACGTYVGDRRATDRVLLTSGNVIRAGQARFRFVEDPARA